MSNLLADLVLIVHLFFILFVLFGGIALFFWEKIFWLHLPAVLWGVAIEWYAWTCPLTPLEKWLRSSGGQIGYKGGFINHYLVPLIYPEGLTKNLQVTIICTVLIVNVVIYTLWYFTKGYKKKSCSSGPF